MAEGTRLYDRGATEAAAAAWGKGYVECGPGAGFLAYQSTAMAKLERYDEAAHLALKELHEPRPTPLALKLVIALKLKVSAAVHSEVLSLGRSPETPIFIPDLQGEYAWIRFLVCGGQEQALRRAPVLGSEVPAGRAGLEIDHVECVCPGGAPQSLYFVDPVAGGAASPEAAPAAAEPTR
jgi:hypothetical protein